MNIFKDKVACSFAKTRFPTYVQDFIFLVKGKGTFLCRKGVKPWRPKVAHGSSIQPYKLSMGW